MATYKECKTLKFPGSDNIYVITDAGKIEKNQGIENAGKIFGVGEDGYATLIEAESLETKIPENLLTYSEQILTDEQKTQARTNIGAGTSEFSGRYEDLTGKPELFSGSYNDLTDTPTLFSGSYNDLTDKPLISNIDVDTELSIDSTNPVQNKVIATALEGKSDSDHTHEGVATTEYVDGEITNVINTVGDMKASVYDTDGSVVAAGGIPEYVDSKEKFFIITATAGTTTGTRILNKSYNQVKEALGKQKICMVYDISNIVSYDNVYYYSHSTDSAIVFNCIRSVSSAIQMIFNSDGSVGILSDTLTTSANNIKTGTFPGVVVAGSQSAATSLLRNSRILSATEADSITPAEGEIIWVYE